MTAAAMLYKFSAQALTILILLRLSSSCPIGPGCLLLSYNELANGKADRDLNHNITAEVNIDKENSVFRPNAVKTMLKNPPDYRSVRANGHCHGYQTFSNNEVSSYYLQTAICPWRYECDYDPQRMPATLFYVKCTNRTVTTAPERHYNCREVYYPVNTIRTSSCDPLRNSTQEWEWERIQNIPVACVASEV